MRLTLVCGALITSAAFSLAPAWAGTAELTGVSGKVLVNGGDGFVPAKNMKTIKPGFEVFLADEATATLHFVDGTCDFALSPASVTRVGSSDMCKQLHSNAAPPRAQKGGVKVTPASDTIVITPAVAGPTGIISPYYIAGGIFSVDAGTFTGGVILQKPISAP